MKIYTAGIAMAVAVLAAHAAPPRLVWSYSAKSNLYAPPLVADMHPAPGLETVISDADIRRLRCIDTHGHQLWEFDGGWTRRLTSCASFSSSAHPGHGTLAVGNADGTLWCIDAATGAGLWKRNVGSIEWGNAVWTDLDGDGRDELIAGTESAGIQAFTADGAPLWANAENVGGPIAAADIDGDGKSEIFAIGSSGPFCLHADGSPFWHANAGDSFMGAPVIADADHDGKPEIYCVSNEPNVLHAFDAASGIPRWRLTLFAKSEMYSSTSIAAGDLDGDGRAEIVLADKLGHVYAVDCTGKLRWVFETQKADQGAVTIGDINGDRRVDVLVASGGHFLYCLDGDGALEWRYETGQRIIHPATIADLDNDGRTDILVCGSDFVVRALTLNAKYDPRYMPWPMQRFDVAARGSNWPAFPATVLAGNHLAKRTAPAIPARVINPAEKVTTRESLLNDGGFERADSAKHPRGWVVESVSGATLTTDTGGGHSGSSSGLVDSKDKETVIASEPLEIEPGVRSVDAEIFTQANAIPRAFLRWIGNDGVLRADALKGAPDSGGWTPLRANGVVPPNGARWFQLVCESGPGQTRLDDASITVTIARRKQLRALVNQVGYDIAAPKRFTAQANYEAATGLFELVDEAGHTQFSGPLESKGHVYGAYGNDWGNAYWRGDFSAFDRPGKYRIHVSAGGLADTSFPFEIRRDLIRERTARLAYRFFYYQRCGTAVPGYHEACHLDDAASPDGARQYDLAGGWHDAGDYNKYNNAPYVFGLAQAYERAHDKFDRDGTDHNRRSDFLDEIMWGGDCVRRMIAPDGSCYGEITSGYGFWGPPQYETDNVPSTGDERRIRGAETGNDSGVSLAATAKLARFSSPPDLWIEAADRAYQWRSARGAKDAYQASAAIDLYLATKREQYAVDARAIVARVGVDNVSVIEQYDIVFHEDHSAQLKESLVKSADRLLALANNPFGVCAYSQSAGVDGRAVYNYFGTPPEGGGWHVGNSSHVLEAATCAALAYQYTHDSKYLAFAYDQLNWILGNNPYGCCLIEGAGSVNLPTYHNRIRYAGVKRGAIPGGIPNGVTWRAPGDDRPYLDMRGVDIPDFEPNEIWLPHNTNYVRLVTELGRISRKDAPSFRKMLP